MHKWLWGLFFPPKCPACGGFLKKNLLDVPKRVLCEPCEQEWMRSKQEVCRRCGEEYSRCLCMPESLGKTGIYGLLKLCSYEKVRETVGKRAILYMKKHNNKRVFAFFGKELAEAFSALEDKPDARVLVTYLPRSRKGVNLYGFDQSKSLAKQVAKALGVRFATVFSRKYKLFAREQKHLPTAARKENMKSAFALAKKGAVQIAGCDLLLIVDDVVTTGASFGGCIALLPGAERQKTVCLSVGISPLVKKRKKRVAILS